MGKILTVNDPYTGAVIRELSFATREDANKILARARDAFSRWKNSPAWERSEVLLTVASELESRREEFIDTMCREAGKPITFAQAELARALGVLRWAAAEAQRFSGELLRLDAARSGRSGFGIHTRFPRGIVLGITPFNFPLNLVIHKIAPAVASGCSILIKPSPSAPLTALKITELFEKYCPGVVQCIVADDSLTEELTRAGEIAMVSFTGSARVGKLIQRQACDKPVVLELGGNAWCIILEDVPESAYPAIARKISTGAFGYAGQSCISVQNVAVAENIWPSLQKHLATATRACAYGAPSESAVVSGPVIAENAAKRIRGALANADAEKGELVRSQTLHGEVSDGMGNLIAPTLITPPGLFTDLSGNLKSLQQEEIFAPVALAGKFDQLDALIRTINSSSYGLQAGVFTQNLAAIEKLYRELEVGGVIINDVPTTRYDHQPYGGVKDSGHGREGIRYAMEEMTYSKFLALSSGDGLFS